MKGYFITFEGGEGAGKTTVLKKVKEDLEQRGIEVLATREPGGIKIAENIRSVILDKANTMMDERTEALLYAAARRQHLIEKVIPALERGAVVLCDRFIDSSLAYQGYARGIDIQDILTINKFAIEHVMPQLTLYFDLCPEIGLARVKSDDSREINRLDLEKMEFHKRVREGYLKLLHTYPERIKFINAEQDINAVSVDSLTIINQVI